MKFVGGKRQKIHPETLDIHFQFAGRLHRVRVAEHAFAVTNGRDFFDGKNNAGFVVGPHHGDNRRVGSNRFFEPVQIKRAVGFDRQECHRVAALLKKFTEFDVRRVLHRGRDDVPFGRIRHQRAVNCRVVALRSATGEDHFARVGVDQRAGFGAGCFNLFGDFIAKRVGARGIAPSFG